MFAKLRGVPRVHLETSDKININEIIKLNNLVEHFCFSMLCVDIKIFYIFYRLAAKRSSVFSS